MSKSVVLMEVKVPRTSKSDITVNLPDILTSPEESTVSPPFLTLSLLGILTIPPERTKSPEIFPPSILSPLI